MELVMPDKKQLEIEKKVKYHTRTVNLKLTLIKPEILNDLPDTCGLQYLMFKQSGESHYLTRKGS
jgi:hypothetical protein